MAELRKKYVEVVADFSPEGVLMPMSVVWDDGTVFEVTCVTEVMPRKYSKVGGIGVRYTCQIGRKRTYLYYEVDKWFVEEKCHAQ